MAHDVDRCPVCRLYHSTCVITGLLEDALPTAQQTGGMLPPGMGGTIALARQLCADGRSQVAPVARMVPGQGAPQIGVMLESMHGLLGGWVDLGTMSGLANRARACRQLAHTIASVHFAAGRPWMAAAWQG